MQPDLSVGNGALPCIWCEDPTEGAPPEHVVPEGLGWPPDDDTLNDVCKKCNHGVLAVLDQALVSSLDIVRWQAAAPTKKGEPSGLSTRSNVFAENTQEGRVAYVNLGPGEVKLPNGRILKAPSRMPSSVAANLKINGRRAEINGRAMILHHPDCSRALHKIAIESIRLKAGRPAVMDPSLQNAKRYVMDGGEGRVVLYTGFGSEYRHELRQPYKGPEGYVVEVLLCGILFTVDLTPDQSRVPFLKKLFEARLEQSGWSWIPIL